MLYVLREHQNMHYAFLFHYLLLFLVYFICHKLRSIDTYYILTINTKQLDQFGARVLTDFFYVRLDQRLKHE